MEQLVKSVGLAILLLIFTSSAFGQVYKMRSTSLSSKYKINNYRWSDWSEAEEASILMTIDMNKDRIIIYSKETQIYDIAEYEGKTTDDDGDDFISYYCVNEEGITCRVRLAKLNSQNGRNQIYIDFSDFRFVYNVYYLD
jgi:hypothetical protein